MSLSAMTMPTSSSIVNLPWIELDEYVFCDGHVYPKVTLYSLNREYADCDAHVKPSDTLFVVGKVLN